jgi:hypothetical protein
MPIALDGDTVEVYLSGDEAKPVETRPAFVCRYLTCRQVLAYEKALKAAHEEKDQEKINDLLNKALGIIIVSQKNMTGDLDDLLSVQEKWELAYRAPDAVQLSELDKKKSLSRSESSGANSEPPAERTVAPTAQVNTPPSS